MRGAFSRVFPEHVLDEVLARTDADLRLATSRNVGTIIITDIRGFKGAGTDNAVPAPACE